MQPTGLSILEEEVAALPLDFYGCQINSFSMYRIFWAYVVVWSGFLLNARAQDLNFSGGAGDGSTSRTTSTLRLNGTIFELSFSGGEGDGSASFAIPISRLNGFENAQSFLGGVADGSAFGTSAVLTLAGIPSQPPSDEISFFGGISDGGFQSQSAAGFLNGNSVTISFSGGNGMGYSSSVSPYYFLSGTPFNFIFAGGNGRGDQIRKSPRYTLNGILAGSFVRVAQSAIHDFKAIPETKHTRLNWKTERPEAIDHFVVQHSSDGQEFKHVGYVSGDRPRSGGFHFLSPLNAAPEKAQFFRIQQVFKDSSFSISEALRLDAPLANQWSNLYPNPSSEFIQLSFEDGFEPRVWKISDVAGQMVETGKTGPDEGPFQIQVKHLPVGLYHLEVQGESESRILRFSKN
jgi:hypothetical protein